LIRKHGLLFLWTQTPLYVGSAFGHGPIDLPVQRDEVSKCPIIAATGIRGALREVIHKRNAGLAETLFGPSPNQGYEYGGMVTCGDARVLLFPVSSIRGVFGWVTCPRVLWDLGRWSVPTGSIPRPNDTSVYGPSQTELTLEGDKVVFENQAFSFQSDNAIDGFVQWLQENAIPDGLEYWQDLLPKRLLVVSDERFRAFTDEATIKTYRIRINYDTRTVAEETLWLQELIPSETLFYAPVFATDARKAGSAVPTAEKALKWLKGELNKIRWIQIGGDRTLGRGWVRIRLWVEGADP